MGFKDRQWRIVRNCSVSFYHFNGISTTTWTGGRGDIPNSKKDGGLNWWSNHHGLIRQLLESRFSQAREAIRLRQILFKLILLEDRDTSDICFRPHIWQQEQQLLFIKCICSKKYLTVSIIGKKRQFCKNNTWHMTSTNNAQARQLSGMLSETVLVSVEIGAQSQAP